MDHCYITVSFRSYIWMYLLNAPHKHTILECHGFLYFLFAVTIFFLVITKQQTMEKTLKTEVQTPLSPSIHLRNQLSSSQVCVHPFVVWVMQVRAIVALNIRASQISDSISDGFLMTCIILPFPCIPCSWKYVTWTSHLRGLSRSGFHGNE